MELTTIYLLAIIWILLSVIVLLKRKGYKHISEDHRNFFIFVSIIFLPLNLIIIFFVEFVIREWDNR